MSTALDQLRALRDASRTESKALPNQVLCDQELELLRTAGATDRGINDIAAIKKNLAALGGGRVVGVWVGPGPDQTAIGQNVGSSNESVEKKLAAEAIRYLTPPGWNPSNWIDHLLLLASKSEKSNPDAAARHRGEASALQLCQLLLARSQSPAEHIQEACGPDGLDSAASSEKVVQTKMKGGGR